MLILSRKKNQKINLIWNGPPLEKGTILGFIEVKLIEGDQVKIGFMCDKDLIIIRDNAHPIGKFDKI